MLPQFRVSQGATYIYLSYMNSLTTNAELNGTSFNTYDEEVEFTPTLRRGDAPSGFRKLNISNYIDFTFNGGWSTAIASFNSLQKMLNDIPVHHETKRRNPVYIEYRNDDTESFWRSKILKARLTHNDDNMLSSSMAEGIIKCKLELIHEPDFETSTVQNIPIRSQATPGTSSTSGITIYPDINAGAGRYNMVHIRAADINSGNMPFPLYFELYDPTPAVETWATYVHVAVDDRSNAETSLVPFMHFDQGGTVVAAGKSYSLTGTETELAKHIGFSSPALAALKGYPYRVLLRLGADAPANTFVRILLKVNSIYEIYRGDLVALSTVNQLNSIGILELPPGAIDIILNQSELVTVHLNGFNTSGSGTLVLKETLYLPTFLYKIYEPVRITTGIAGAGALYDYDEQVFVATRTATDATMDTRGRTYVPYGSPIYLEPNKNYTIYFMYTTVNDFTTPTKHIIDPLKQLAVKAYTRFKRSSI